VSAFVRNARTRSNPLWKGWRAPTVVALAGLAAVGEWQLHWLLPADAAAADVRDAAPEAVAAPIAAPSGEVPRALAPARPVQPSAVAAAAPAVSPERDAVAEAWHGTPVAFLPKELGAVGPALKLALDKQQREDMEFCFRDPNGNGRMAPQTPRRAASLMLFLEAREGAVDVVHARIANAGTLPPEVLECAREVMQGLGVQLASAEPGKKLKYLYEIEE
jgi:hypothetical protein